MIPKKDDGRKPVAYTLESKMGSRWRVVHLRLCVGDWREDVDTWIRQSPDHRAQKLVSGGLVGGDDEN